MRRVHLLAALGLCCVSGLALSEPATWLMQGDVLTDEEAASRLVRLDTHKTYLPVSTRAEVYYSARPGKLVNCVIAAAVHQQGHVSVVEGGRGSKRVRIRYVTRDGRPDLFFVLVQAAGGQQPVSVVGNVVSNGRLGIVHEPVRSWTATEIHDAMRNVTASLLSPLPPSPPPDRNSVPARL